MKRFIRPTLVALAVVIVMMLPGCFMFFHLDTPAGYTQESPSPSAEIITSPHPSASVSPGPSQTASPQPTETPVEPPAAFDLRKLGGTAAVEDQGDSNDCWAYAALAAFESDLAYQNGVKADLSENHLTFSCDTTRGNDWGFYDVLQQGGNSDIVSAYLARHSGPVSESAFKYTSPPKPDVTRAVEPAYIARQILYIPTHVDDQHPVASAEDIKTVKQAIIRYGGVCTDIRMDERYFSERADTYYFPERLASGRRPADHSVTLVGWDDSFPANKFIKEPPADGAWIAQNSYGTGWGDGGYFYISYNDAYVCSFPVAYTDIVQAQPNERAYVYDPLGVNQLYSPRDADQVYGANVFDREQNGGAAAGEVLTSISVYLDSPGTAVTVSVGQADNAGDPSTFSLSQVGSATFSEPGYRTIVLDKPIPLTQRWFCVSVCFSGEEGIELPVESRVDGYAKATSSPGQSWYSSSGDFWSDITSVKKDSNLCIKAFTTVPLQ